MASKLKMLASNDGTLEQYAMFQCPGCGYPHCLGVGPKATGAKWTWNGDKEKPTFTPSVLGRHVDSVCHSFITNGQIQFLGDCTHKLAGQTVPLPDWADD